MAGRVTSLRVAALLWGASLILLLAACGEGERVSSEPTEAALVASPTPTLLPSPTPTDAQTPISTRTPVLAPSGLILFVRNGNSIWRIDPSGEEERQIYAIEADKQISNLIPSPDGRKVAAEGSGELIVLDTDGKLYFRESEAHLASWSPDSRLVSYSVGDVSESQRWIARFDGSEKTPIISDGSFHIVELVWSPIDPEEVFFTAVLPLWGNPAWKVGRARLISSQLTDVEWLTEPAMHALDLKLSPTGQGLMWRSRCSNLSVIKIHDLRGGSPPCAAPTLYSEAGAWSSDGAKVAFISFSRESVPGPYAYPFDLGIWVMNADCSEARLLVPWIVDGSKYPFIFPREVWEGWQEGGEAWWQESGEQIPEIYARIEEPRPQISSWPWAFNNQQIIYWYSSQDGLWIMNADGSDKRQLTQGNDHLAIWIFPREPTR